MQRTLRPAAAAALVAILVAVALSGCTHSSGSTAKFCAQVRKVPALESVLARFSEADPDVLRDRIDKARSAYDSLETDAPSEIAGDTKAVVSLVDDVLDAVEQNPSDPAKAAAQLRTAMARHQGVEAKRAKLTAYARTTCDVQLDATLTESTPSGPTSTTSSGSTTTSTTLEPAAITTTTLA